MKNKEFIERIYELTFGDNAIGRDFSHEEVVGHIEWMMDECTEKTNILDDLECNFENVSHYMMGRNSLI